MKRTQLREIIKSIYEELMSSAADDYNYMVGKNFNYWGRDYTIKSIRKSDKGPIVVTTSGNEFDMNTLKMNRVRFPEKSQKVYSTVISKEQYNINLVRAVKNAGGRKWLTDIAQTLIHNPDMRARLELDYPNQNESELIKRLQSDLESVRIDKGGL